MNCDGVAALNVDGPEDDQCEGVKGDCTPGQKLKIEERKRKPHGA